VTGSQASRITYTLDSSLDSVNRVEQTAEQVAQKAGFDDDEVFRVSMAAREAAVNAVLHGNAYSPLRRRPNRWSSASPTRVRGSIRRPCPIPSRRTICSVAPAAVSFLSVRSWMK
jgi:hypothetical protein